MPRLQPAFAGIALLCSQAVQAQLPHDLPPTDGTTFLHLGDTQSDPHSWTAAGLPARGVDVALVPYCYALDETRFAALVAVTRAHMVVLLHAPLTETVSGPGGGPAASRDLRRRYPQVEIPASPGAAVVLRDSGADLAALCLT